VRYRFHTADVFTDQIFGGNPLAVFPDARGLDAGLMQLITREINYSETAFVFPPETPAGTRRLRIFTPGAEMPFAGHPTVGSAFVLAETGALPLQGETTWIIFEEGVGPVPVMIRTVEGRPAFCQLSAPRMPEWGPEPPADSNLAAVLSLSAADLLSGTFRPQAVSCGVPFLFVPVRNMDAVRRARVRLDLWERVFAQYWAQEIYIFSFEHEREGSDVHARMFAPRLGISEDPATGAAATALAGYLGSRDARTDDTLRWVAEQGFEMGRPSILTIEADKQGEEITAIRVGGAAVLVSTGEMEIARVAGPDASPRESVSVDGDPGPSQLEPGGP
jgi:trans-2,3-dihydro-3-hydroxyanthranilate isomerase